MAFCVFEIRTFPAFNAHARVYASAQVSRDTATARDRDDPRRRARARGRAARSGRVAPGAERGADHARARPRVEYSRVREARFDLDSIFIGIAGAPRYIAHIL